MKHAAMASRGCWSVSGNRWLKCADTRPPTARKSPGVPMPVIERFEPRELGVKSWGRELLIAETDSYIGKVLWMEKGHGGPLQYHELKDETFYLLSGIARVSYHDEDGGLRQ